ncbi:MAG: GGDEF domain-containing protein [Pseudohongiellaceae bacterium]
MDDRKAATHRFNSSDARDKNPLTGLAGQDWFNQQLDRLISGGTCRQTTTLALLQLENFYEILSWIGRIEADLLLHDLARLLEKSVPEGSLLCHCRNHEFAVLLYNQGDGKVRLVADRIRQALQTGTSLSIPPQLKLRCGVGLATVNTKSPSATVLFARARHNLSLAQSQSGREFLLNQAVDTEQLLSRISRCLQRRCLRLSFQPVVSLAADRVQRYEVRARLIEPHYKATMPTRENVLNPGLFMEPLVQNALGESLDRLVLEAVAGVLTQARQPALQFIVNLTQNSLVSRDFPVWLEAAGQKWPALSPSLVLQLSEIDILCAQHHMAAFSRKLRDLNLVLSVSHFGCTENPFRYLPLLRAGYAKLDPSLCGDLINDGIQRELVASIAGDLNRRGIRPIACMLETMPLLAPLWQAGVRLVQGNCLQAPVAQFNYAFPRERKFS